MRRILSASVLVLLFALTVGFAQEQATESAPPEAIPVATQTEVECSGFLSPELIAKSIVHTNAKEKLEFIQELGSVLHHEDDRWEIADLKKAGIETVNLFNSDKWEEHMNSL